MYMPHTAPVPRINQVDRHRHKGNPKGAKNLDSLDQIFDILFAAGLAAQVAQRVAGGYPVEAQARLPQFLHYCGKPFPVWIPLFHATRDALAIVNADPVRTDLLRKQDVPIG